MPTLACPSCGADVPLEAGQHSPAPVGGVLTCPSCGAEVKLEQASAPAAGAPRAEAPPPAEEDFSGSETVAGVMEELSEKEGGPQ